MWVIARIVRLGARRGNARQSRTGGRMSHTITPELPDTGAARIGGPDCVLGEDEVRAFVREQLGRFDLDGASVCLLVPDGTRSCPCRSCCRPSTAPCTAA